MRSRSPVGYVVQIDGSKVTLNLLDRHRGQVATHSSGVSHVTEIGSLLGIEAGSLLLVLRITGLNFAEPKEVHRQTRGLRSGDQEPLRHLEGIIVGWIGKENNQPLFRTDNTVTPPLGAEVFPLSSDELKSAIAGVDSGGPIIVGHELRSGQTVKAGLNGLLSRHLAVLGSSGQGKSCFTAAVLQQLANMPSARIVVFDINGEYHRTFRKSEEAIAGGDFQDRLPQGKYKHTAIGSAIDGATGRKIPYYALGRQGLHRLLLPSDKTQRPALSFAIDHLRFIEWNPTAKGASVVGGTAVLFDDCRNDGAEVAYRAMEQIRARSSGIAGRWPHMSALGTLIAESHAITAGRNGRERNAFNYGNVSPLITRLHRLVEDEMFKAVVEVNGGSPCGGNASLNWRKESEHLIDDIFGSRNSTWQVHVVNLKQVPQDLMPLILGSLLELYAQVLFSRGQGGSPATLLVLEEAHHYLRSPSNSEEDRGSALAYERLAKEGRKFGLSLWLSTQRPSEVSATVLSQCNNWVVFKLNSEQDQRVVANACEWAEARDVRRISGLPRQHAMLLGGSFAMPTVVKAPTADPTPESHDGEFDAWNEVPEPITDVIED
ncbi:MAG: ATP-binding protein [Verrucomicrobia bacterium]|nr:ATP-binding protein [Verrucomicrobiota bacterium]